MSDLEVRLMSWKKSEIDRIALVLKIILSTMTLSPSKALLWKKFAKRMLELPFKIKWHCDTRGDTINLKILKLMKKAGCNHIYLGLESGSPKIQKMIKKNIDNAKIKTAVRMARRAGIETTVYFMVKLPGRNRRRFDTKHNCDGRH